MAQWDPSHQWSKDPPTTPSGQPSHRLSGDPPHTRGQFSRGDAADEGAELPPKQEFNHKNPKRTPRPPVGTEHSVPPAVSAVPGGTCLLRHLSELLMADCVTPAPSPGAHNLQCVLVPGRCPCFQEAHCPGDVSRSRRGRSGTESHGEGGPFAELPLSARSQGPCSHPPLLPQWCTLRAQGTRGTHSE